MLTFAGYAPEAAEDEEPGVFQIYFTGSPGNVTAGKYNDGNKANRVVLRDRMYNGMKEAFKATKRMPASSIDWRVESVKLKPRSEAAFGEAESLKALQDEKAPKARRGNAASTGLAQTSGSSNRY